MSSTLVAGRTFLSAPAPRPPMFGLTGSPGAATVPDGNLRGGAFVEPYPTDLPGSEDPCLPLTARGKDDPTAYDQPGAFPTFTAYLGEICTSRAIGDWGEWTARANAALEARTSWALERQLAWQWFTDADQPYLADADADLPAGAGALTPAVAVAWLEAYLADQGEQGVLHIPPAVVSYLGMQFFRVSGSTLYTAAGTPVIVGPGYGDSDGGDNLDPAASGAGEAAAGQAWIFASGPVLYQMGDVMALPETQGEAVDRTDNTVVYRAERDLWVGFDGQRHAAALADWTP